MMSRREMLGAGMLGTLAGGETEAQSNQDAAAIGAGLGRIDESLDDIRNSVDQGLRGNSMSFGLVGVVRTELQRYMKTSGRFPEYLDIGVRVFFDIYDWHVRNQQQIQISRMQDQRMVIQFMLTQLVLRWESAEDFVGIAYDR